MDLGTLKSLSALAMLAVLLLWESLAPYFAFFAGSSRLRLTHALRNVGLGLINAVCTAVVLATLWTWITAWTAAHEFGVLHWLQLQGWQRLAAAFLLFDLWMYWWHRLNHRNPWLWRLHRVHHSDPQMDVTTAQRFHLGEILLSSLLRVPVLALIGMNLIELALYETVMFANVQLHHANIGLPAWLDRAARTVLITPALHKVHHSRLREETDSNYGSLLAWWDLLFATRRTRQQPQTIDIGLDGFDAPAQQTLGGLLRMPSER